MISKPDISARCLKLAQQRYPDAKVDSDLANEGFLDSLDMVELNFDIENEFAVSITDEEAEKAATVEDFTDIVFNKLMRAERADQAARGITRKGS